MMFEAGERGKRRPRQHAAHRECPVEAVRWAARGGLPRCAQSALLAGIRIQNPAKIAKANGAVAVTVDVL